MRLSNFTSHTKLQNNFDSNYIYFCSFDTIRFLNKILLKLGKENIAAGNSVIGLINESLQAAKVIISYGNKNKSLNKIGKQTENYNKTAIRQRLLQSLSSNAFKPIAILILIITFGYVGNIKANLSYLAAIFGVYILHYPC